VRSIYNIGLVVTFLLSFYAASIAGETPKYVGAKQCETCHGNEYAIWSKGPHAKAYLVLGSGSNATKKSMDFYKLSGNPQEAATCLNCHVTGGGASGEPVAKSSDFAEGITCERCHGPGSLYSSAMLRDAKKYEKAPADTVAEWSKLGLVKPDEALCRSCHTYGDFNFSEKFGKIAHSRKRDSEEPISPKN